MKVFISGGCKNGKSRYAQALARSMAQACGKPLYYLATMIPSDEEDRLRIKRHLAERDGWGFETIEQGRDICRCLDEGGKTLSGHAIDPAGVFLLDSVTALLSNEMFSPDGSFNAVASEKVAGDLKEFCLRADNVVFVSDYIYSDASLYDRLTEEYRKGLAFADRTLAALCDQVTEVSYGFIQNYK